MQTGGLGKLKMGTIIVMMDFRFVDEHVELFYDCLRDRHVMLVCVSWNMEHWFWIVREDVDLADPSIYECYVERDVVRTAVLTARMGSDLLLLSGLTDDVSVHEAFASHRILTSCRISWKRC